MGEAKKTNKSQKTGFYARQYGRTANNKTAARNAHRARHPKDEAAMRNWTAHPVRLKK